MMAKLVCASALLAVAGAAQAAVFGINTVDAGGIPGGSLGNPITWATGGGAFNPPAGSNVPPSQFASPATLFFDSYAMLDPNGRSLPASSSTISDGYSALGPGNIIFPNATPTTLFSPAQSVTTGPGSMSGVWFNAAAGGGFVNSGPEDRIYIAQITLRAGATLDTQGVLVNIKDAGTGPNGSLGFLRFGLANATNNGGLWGATYYLDFRARAVEGVAAFAGGTSYEVFVQQVPTPGAAGLAGIAGLVALRRRRA